MDERVFFEHDGVKITNARFVVDGQTYAMSNITSVKTGSEGPPQTGPAILFLVGLFVAPHTALSAVIGIALIALAIYWGYQQKPTYHVVLMTSGGEAKALKTREKPYVEQVVSALNDAIVSRG